jgi:hypothetical protein
MIHQLENKPGVKVTHLNFSDDEYIYEKENGNIYDESWYLFEDWYSEGMGRHDGIRQRVGGNWNYSWEIWKEK